VCSSLTSVCCCFFIGGASWKKCEINKSVKFMNYKLMMQAMHSKLSTDHPQPYHGKLLLDGFVGISECTEFFCFVLFLCGYS
jgi:hypothetical protein